VSSPQPATDSSSRSIGELLSEVTTDLSTLMRQEVELAKAELAQSAKRAGRGAGLSAGALVAAHFALLFLSIALWWALGRAIGLGWSAVVVGVAWAVVAGVLAMLGRREFSDVRGLDRTGDTVKKIPNAVKGHEEQNR